MKQKCYCKAKYNMERLFWIAIGLSFIMLGAIMNETIYLGAGFLIIGIVLGSLR